MTTAQALKNQETRRERQRETHRRIAQIVYDVVDIERLHEGEPIVMSDDAKGALRGVMKRVKHILERAE